MCSPQFLKCWSTFIKYCSASRTSCKENKYWLPQLLPDPLLSSSCPSKCVWTSPSHGSVSFPLLMRSHQLWRKRFPKCEKDDALLHLYLLAASIWQHHSSEGNLQPHCMLVNLGLHGDRLPVNPVEWNTWLNNSVVLFQHSSRWDCKVGGRVEVTGWHLNGLDNMMNGCDTCTSHVTLNSQQYSAYMHALMLVHANEVHASVIALKCQ